MGVPTLVVSKCLRSSLGGPARVLGVRCRSVRRLSLQSPGDGPGRDWLLLPRLRRRPWERQPLPTRSAPSSISGSTGSTPTVPALSSSSSRSPCYLPSQVMGHQGTRLSRA